MSTVTCNRCKGRGQDRSSRTEFHFEERKLPNGKVRKQYVTDKCGSGCRKCLGVGQVRA